ncbi:MAG TPA: TonB-dependent receptor [Telluria sp.]|nr:TonB-dependent receptor [Telluria sp.]
MVLHSTALGMAALLMLASSAGFASVPAATDSFANLSLEELANIQVTSVSRRAERLGDTPASVFVIRGDDIRRAGAATLPEALRLAPNLQVARVDARNYAVTARGFNSPFENKLLVLIDGRTVYSPLFSGVYWDAQDVLLEDVERIEVISGPGATVWGANAVNGVINIITRSAAATQGGLVQAGGASDGRDGAVRYGGAAGRTWYRLYAKYAEADDLQRANGSASLTGMRRSQAGFRADTSLDHGSLTVQGDAYHGGLHQQGTREIRIGGANLLARGTLTLADDSELMVKAYVDHTERDQPNAFVEALDTLDLELQHTLRPRPGHLVIWGGGYRSARDHVDNARSFAFLPPFRTLAWTNVFAQDEIALTPDLRLGLGLKFERNSYTGLESLPHLSIAWNVAPERMWWASLARAVRVPSRIDRDFYAPSAPRVVNGVPQYGIAGGPDFQSETARVLQTGYRARHGSLIYAATLYYSRYTRLRTLEPNPAGPGQVFLNKAAGDTYGAELSSSWNVTPDLRVSLGHTVQRLDLRTQADSRDATAATGIATNDPSSWSMLRVSYDWSDRTELDLTLRHVGPLPRPAVPGYTALDLRAGWQLTRALELSLAARNLGADRHPEFGAAPARTLYDRDVAARLTWRF